MTDPHYAWVRVTRQNPCPICDKPDNCEVSRDGEMVWCGRVSEGSIKENGGGQYLHRLCDRPRVLSARPPVPASKPRTQRSARYFQVKGCRWYEATTAGIARNRLAQLLGVSSEVLDRLKVGWSSWSRLWTFPERNAAGDVTGIVTRDENGMKKRMAGGKAGLTFARDWQSDPGPILLVEGPSDVAAALTMGLCAIGRPSNTGGTAHLADLLEQCSDRELIVIGERDLKPNGLWPGKDGAISTATKLAEMLDRSIGWSFPPDNAKDTRAWLREAGELPTQRYAKLFLDGLNITAVEPPPVISPVEPSGPVVSLKEWREWMLRERTASLEKPGYYLDSSATGAGKSTIDFNVIMNAMNAESA